MTGAEGVRSGGLTARWAGARPKTPGSAPCSERNESNCAKLAGSGWGRTRGGWTRSGISAGSLPGKSVVCGCGIMPRARALVHRHTLGEEGLERGEGKGEKRGKGKKKREERRQSCHKSKVKELEKRRRRRAQSELQH